MEKIERIGKNLDIKTEKELELHLSCFAKIVTSLVCGLVQL